jgi:membrane protease YdiL (CAAX protease family)
MILVVSIGTAMQLFSFGWGLIATEVLLIFIPALLYLKQSQQPFRETTRIKKLSWKLVLTSLMIGVGLWLVDSVLEGLMSAITGFAPPVVEGLLPTTLGQALLVFTGLAIAAPICEEIFFRGVIQTQYAKNKRPWAAITFTALIFAFYHMRLQGLPALLPVAFVLCYVYLRTQNLTASIIVHFGNNFMAAIIVVLAGLRPDLVLPFPSLPAALIGLIMVVAGIWLLNHLCPASAEVEVTPAVESKLKSFWPLFIAGIIYLAVAGMEVLTGISGNAPQYIHDNWQEAQTLTYQINNKINKPVGTITCRIEPQKETIFLNCESDLEEFELKDGSSYYYQAKLTSTLEAVWNAEDLNLVQLDFNADFNDFTQSWEIRKPDDLLQIIVTRHDGSSEGKDLDDAVLIKDEWPWRLSALAFGEKTLFTTNYLQPMTWRQEQQNSGPVITQEGLLISGPEPLEMETGTIQAWRVVLGRNQQAWYAVDAPHTLLKYEGSMLDYVLID